ncbi:MAG: hypothetical protein GOMPHAMPRED_000280 [Gomphillus americanus]|uniref:Rhodopsin domain-containing protein n=1 Tax=Gomphillus americanus TaxID=1940652 RepID=A0A8H3EDW3_9LECA|nr:MAG: hypothetical protein GOMPHAMPRED_000280 [Gomphillus americanus]
MASIEYAASYDTSFNGIASMISMMFLLPSITLALRIVARYKQKMTFDKDDVFAILAWFFDIGPTVLGIYGMAIHAFGYSTPSDETTLREVRALLWKGLYAGLLTSICALGCARLSAIFFYRRIFHTGKVDAFDIITRIMIIIVVVWTVGFCISTTLSCGTNVSGIWAANNTAVCGLYTDERALTISSSVLDLVVLMLPLHKIWKLHTSGARKIAISLVFLLALVGVVSSVIRATMFWVISNRGAAANLQDAFRANTRNFFYQLLELGAVTTAINLPSIWYFFRGLSPERVLRSVRSLVSLRSSSTVSQDEKSTYKQSVIMGATNSGAIPSKRAQHELDLEEQ